MNNPITASVLDEVLSERADQDQQWGGPTHDDRHTVQNFLTFIEAKLGKAWEEAAPGRTAGRRRLLQVAALAVAAIEKIDRMQGSDAGQAGQPRQTVKASS